MAPKTRLTIEEFLSFDLTLPSHSHNQIAYRITDLLKAVESQDYN
jgi:hypothetical protein